MRFSPAHFSSLSGSLWMTSLGRATRSLPEGALGPSIHATDENTELQPWGEGCPAHGRTYRACALPLAAALPGEGARSLPATLRLREAVGRTPGLPSGGVGGAAEQQCACVAPPLQYCSRSREGGGERHRPPSPWARAGPVQRRAAVERGQRRSSAGSTAHAPEPLLPPIPGNMASAAHCPARETEGRGGERAPGPGGGELPGVPAPRSGLRCGEGLWEPPASVLSVSRRFWPRRRVWGNRGPVGVLGQGWELWGPRVRLWCVLGSMGALGEGLVSVWVQLEGLGQAWMSLGVGGSFELQLKALRVFVQVFTCILTASDLWWPVKACRYWPVVHGSVWSFRNDLGLKQFINMYILLL